MVGAGLDLEAVRARLTADGCELDPHASAWLELLVRGLAEEADLSAWGRYLAGEQIQASARAGVEARAGATDRPPEVALVIAGLPRTGTTLLQSLFAAGADAWVPTTLEYQRPVFLGRPGHAPAEVRDEEAGRLEAFLRYAPEFTAIHPTAVGSPEECDVLLAAGFESFRWLLLHRLPTYAARWLGADHTTAYRDLRRAIAGRAGRHPAVLKAPGHLAAYDAVLDQLDPVLVVQVHRPAAQLLASWLSLVRSARSVFSTDAGAPHALAAEWLTCFEHMVERAEPVVARSPERFVGLRFDEVVADPVAVVDHLAALTGIDLDGDHRATMTAAGDELRRRSSHDYPPVPPGFEDRVAALDQRYAALVHGGSVR